MNEYEYFCVEIDIFQKFLVELALQIRAIPISHIELFRIELIVLAGRSS